MTKRKTDGERIAAQIDRLLRKRMSEAWEEGWFARDCQESDWNENPYGPDAACLAHSPRLLSAALAEVESLTRERDEARAEMMEEAAKLVASWDEGGCECGGYGCSCGNFNDAVTAAVAATARGMANKLRARAETLRAKP